ncbi:16S rRNA (cytidine(1402)-2'-O)-methyltransferase [Ruminococcus sp. HUN007]|uniref:16S rRNA (cytidine(1402)-2'-O)-methyltransferase n=1 Tax=Ruminococcus sp. HUN007 TaxID=1514668 RepID=UPI0005D27F86|nr:16S rRNA (cytidine(1402)-2'-O)-methyltransferase [Ruminococcus sp. HUN007]
MPGTLYVLGTPIGNISDITLRALDILGEVDFIAAEDTRVTLKLLNRYDIKKPLVSYHDHSSRSCAETIINRLAGGETAAVVTDAGMPCISDPGEDLVKLCYENDIPVRVIPGPSAVVSALAVSGLSTSRFSFEGFLSVTRKQRIEHLEEVKDNKNTMIFYEAPHKLVSTLEDMHEYFGDRRISLCRELTKVYEEVIRTTLSGALEYYSEKSPKGEYVLVIEGKPESDEPECTIELALEMVRRLVDEGEKTISACKKVAKETGYKKSELYQMINSEKE